MKLPFQTCERNMTRSFKVSSCMMTVSTETGKIPPLQRLLSILDLPPPHSAIGTTSTMCLGCVQYMLVVILIPSVAVIWFYGTWSLWSNFRREAPSFSCQPFSNIQTSLSSQASRVFLSHSLLLPVSSVGFIMALSQTGKSLKLVNALRRLAFRCVRREFGKGD